MENHPIPQDVTGFKFKLIGSMTVKQFLYILAFGILATVAFVLHINIFLKVPLVLLFAGIGSALAFLPIEGRPMDLMIANFAKTIPSENRYIFKKRGANLVSFGIFETPTQTKASATTRAAVVANEVRDVNSDKRAMLISRLRNSPFRPDSSEVTTLNNIHTLFENDKAVITPILNTAKAAEKAPQVMTEAPKHEIQTQTVMVTPTEEIAPVAPVATQPIPTEPKPAAAPYSSLPDIGNVVMGKVSDPRGKPLPNILVEVIDQSGTPLRAFKTNAKGEFAAATPLPNGAYKISFDDGAKQHEFRNVDINLDGQIFQPIESTSIDAREKLRQELFGGAQAVAAA